MPEGLNIWVIIAFAVAAVLGFVLTYPCIMLAPKLGFMDVPKDERRMHERPTPRIGGIAVFLAFTVGVIVSGQIVDMLPYLIGGLIIMVTGMVDDRKGLKPWIKILGQALCGVIICLFGITARYFTFFGHTIDVGYFAYPLTVIWVVAVINIINLIDGLDGLCTGVSVFACSGMALVSLLFADGRGSVIALILLCAAIGFLPHNAHPAKTFLGDMGSMFFGFMLAALSCEIFFCTPGESAFTLSALTPFALLGIPMFDTTYAIIRRKLSGKPIFCGDKKHVHHRLNERYGHGGAVALIYLASAILVAIAILLNATFVSGIVGVCLMVLALAYAIIRFAVYKK